MNEGEKIFLESIGIFALVCGLFLAYGVFVSPNLYSDRQNIVEEPKAEVLAAIDQQNPYAYGCLENAPITNVPESYETIQEAIDSVEQGTIINVSPGSYYENLKLRPGICLIGDVGGKTELIGSIFMNSNSHIRNFKVVGEDDSAFGILAQASEMVSIEANSFLNFETAIIVEEGSKVNISSNSFRNVSVGISVTDSFFFTTQNNVEANEASMFVKNSVGDIVGKVLANGEYGVKAENSEIFFNKNIFRNQSIGGMYLDSNGDYEIGDNFFEKIDEEIIYY
jgi:hypothetical protein